MWVALRTSKQRELARFPRDQRYRHQHLLHPVNIDAVLPVYRRRGPVAVQTEGNFSFSSRRDCALAEPWLAYPGFAARSNVQHPERHFQNPTTLDLFQAAIRYRVATFYETGMQPHCPAMPWMPGIADFTTISNMGVVLLSCIMANETTKASVIDSLFPIRNQLALCNGVVQRQSRLGGMLSPCRLTKPPIAVFEYCCAYVIRGEAGLQITSLEPPSGKAP